MGISNLSGPGSGYRSSVGAGSFSKRLSSATRHGNLNNLRDNMPAIKKGLKGYERVIRLGGLSRMQKLSAWKKIKAADKNITREDARDIKKVLDHLGK